MVVAALQPWAEISQRLRRILESFKPFADSSHNFVARTGFYLASEIGLITSLRLRNPQLLYIAIGKCV